MCSHRKNRNSMPATAQAFRGRNDRPDISSVMSYGHQINTTKFLFGDDEPEKSVHKKDQSSTTSPDVNSYLLMNATDDKFPILIRNQNNSDEVRTSPKFTGAVRVNDCPNLCSSFLLAQQLWIWPTRRSLPLLLESLLYGLHLDGASLPRN